jgi:hypothetical protein
MILGITEDFSTNITLDAELTSLPSSGLYLNSGVHPSITVNNLLSFLSFEDITIADWDIATTYGIYSQTKKKSDLVSYNGKIYQCILANNGLQPDENADEWLETNLDSLKLKNFLSKVEDRVYADLRLTKRLINNQFIYNVGKVENLLPNDYSAWIFEPKGSDYVTIKLNQVSIQKSGTTPINLYVINQGVLVDTLTITPSDGKVEFKDLNYSFSGKGKWIFAIDSTEVFTTTSYVDMLQYDGFVCYTASGIGGSAESATYMDSIIGNGLGFNVSVELNSQLYIDNNISSLGNFVRATFELMTLELFLNNSENRGNRNQQIQMDRDNLIAETKSLDMNTVARRYNNELAIARKTIAKTFDTQLSVEISDFEIDETSI